VWRHGKDLDMGIKTWTVRESTAAHWIFRYARISRVWPKAIMATSTDVVTDLFHGRHRWPWKNCYGMEREGKVVDTANRASMLFDIIVAIDVALKIPTEHCILPLMSERYTAYVKHSPSPNW
jgi:hypothetical protein